MSVQYLFDFISEISENLGTLTKEIEKSLFSHPQTVLVQARLYSENLVKIISKEEGIEDIYPLKHAERIYKLYKQNAIEEEIYVKLEWLRKKGNKAAHDIKSAQPEDGFKAHRYLFDISVWYMQVYVNYEFDAPIYMLPIQDKEDKTVISEKELEKMVKPLINERMKEIDEIRQEIQRELANIKKEKESISQSSNEPQDEKEDRNKSSFSLLEYLEDQEIKYIDNRHKNGALWLIGDWSLNEKVFPLKDYKIYFRFVHKGGKATNYEPGWFLLNKNYIEENDEVAKDKIISDKYYKEEKSQTSISVIVKRVPKTFWEQVGQMKVPIHLQNIKLEECKLPSLRALNSCYYFPDITEQALRLLYKESKEDFFSVIYDLFWLGFRFDEKMEAFQPVRTTSIEEKVTIEGSENIELTDIMPFAIVEKFKEKEIKYLNELNNMLVSSIVWLTKSEDIGWLKKVFHSKNVESIETKSKEINTEKHIIRFFENEISVSWEVANEEIEMLGIEGCSHFVSELKLLGISRLRDIDFPLDGLSTKLKGVGEKRIIKFLDQIPQTLHAEDMNDKNSCENQSDKILRYSTNVIHVSKELEHIELKGDDYPGAEKAVEKLKEHGICCLLDLPNDLTELIKLQGFGKGKVKRLSDKLPDVILREKKRIELERLSPEEYLLYLFKSAEDWLDLIIKNEKVAKEEKIQSRYVELMKRKFNASLEERHLTLEELGQQIGVTRERIRQILAKGDEKIAIRLKDILEVYFKTQPDNIQLLEFRHLDLDSFIHYIMSKGIERLGYECIKNKDIVYITRLNKDQLESIEATIRKYLEINFSSKVINKKDLLNFCKNVSEEKHLSISYVERIANNEVNWLSHDRALLKSTKKKDVVEMVMLQYPAGVEVYKQEEELIAKANDYMPGQFQGERSFYSIATRFDLSEKIILWDRGKYIHESYVKKNESFIKHAQQVALQMVEEDGPIHVLKLYQRLKKQALEQNIISEYGLYSLMRQLRNDQLSLQAFPTIYPAGVEKQMNAEYIEQFISNDGGRTTYQKLYNHFVEGRGWKKFTLEHNLSTNPKFVQFRHAEYTLLSNYSSITSNDLDFITDQIVNKIDASPIILISSFFEENEMLLKSKGIETKNVLYAILKDLGHNFLRFPRYPYILSIDAKKDHLSAQRLIENFIEEKKEIVSREEIIQWMLDIFGEDDSFLDLTLLNSKEILYYTRGKYGEYIHSSTIGYTKDMENKVLTTARQLYQNVSAIKEREYILLEEIYAPQYLPRMEGDIDWNEELFGDMLKKSNQWNMIGSYDAILTPKNSFILTYTDFIGYLLKEKFGGSAKLKVFQKYLDQIKYSSDGKLLFEVEEALERNLAPFEIDGDEIMLKDWSEQHYEQ
ncbi:sigma factor-like helix-turn-helix DNA-binding protein [Anaerobacillus sp. 1_MG-2023]|uniref:sigma factor-like helix-turn-helix DNA-binding protein n=1 Tax=Anaerobacillus sp. 1_MG-2023 TaxID=3062655 RepID=UPI0026E21FFD|nr:sigma factor-like helix-turn-helix DNA-binding protein [Anaerobacillus sp. 1_MG-2023]MDO6654517.1 sigma factor-like helix-turn-helix DNA-binding protein [Anaerobacillus sp. 1_MG-2023]